MSQNVFLYTAIDDINCVGRCSCSTTDVGQNIKENHKCKMKNYCSHELRAKNNFVWQCTPSNVKIFWVQWSQIIQTFEHTKRNFEFYSKSGRELLETWHNRFSLHAVSSRACGFALTRARGRQSSEPFLVLVFSAVVPHRPWPVYLTGLRCSRHRFDTALQLCS